MRKRAILIVLDSVGIGALPDAAEFDDVGANTLGHIQERHPLNIPNMRKLGIGHIRLIRRRFQDLVICLIVTALYTFVFIAVGGKYAEDHDEHAHKCETDSFYGKTNHAVTVKHSSSPFPC